MTNRSGDPARRWWPSTTRRHGSIETCCRWSTSSTAPRAATRAPPPTPRTWCRRRWSRPTRAFTRSPPDQHPGMALPHLTNTWITSYRTAQRRPDEVLAADVTDMRPSAREPIGGTRSAGSDGRWTMCAMRFRHYPNISAWLLLRRCRRLPVQGDCRDPGHAARHRDVTATPKPCRSAGIAHRHRAARGYAA